MCDKYLPGVTAIIAREDMALRHMSTWRDTKNLGKWILTKIMGKNGNSVPFKLSHYTRKSIYATEGSSLEVKVHTNFILSTLGGD